MQRYARIVDGAAVSVLDAAGDLPPHLRGYVAVDETCAVGKVMIDGIWTTPSVDLDALRAALRARIDAAAEAVREQWITPGDGQAMAYQAKAAEAASVQAIIDAGGTPAEADHPHLAAEIGTTAADLAGVAAVVLARRAQWIAASAQIEALRLAAKAAVRAETTESEIRQAAAVAWPHPTT